MSTDAALLALEDGTTFHGTAYGARGTALGEVVFNTGMTGYPEVLTDPSYHGQMVCMTYPLIGNYGITEEDFESRRLWLCGFIVREVSRIPSNRRSRMALPELLKAQNVIGIEGLDTRSLVRHIRLAGAMKAALSTEVLDEKELVLMAKDSPGLVGRDLVQPVSTDHPFDWIQPLSYRQARAARFDVTVYDYGVKYNILRHLVSAGCRVHVVPGSTPAATVLERRPDGVVLSNGPGDPAALSAIVREVKQLLGKAPILGICLGQQLLGQALGGKTFKLRFGHHGSNHPVKDLRTGKVEITTQNHGFCVDADSLDRSKVEITHVNLNDNTLEGLRHKELPVFSVQYHPEAGPGPHDSGYLFDRFIELMELEKSVSR